ncbi:MAG: hypothetical protein ACPGVG_13415, partial [Mycobacterium sp.]
LGSTTQDHVLPVEHMRMLTTRTDHHLEQAATADDLPEVAAYYAGLCAYQAWKSLHLLTDTVLPAPNTTQRATK